MGIPPRGLVGLGVAWGFPFFIPHASKSLPFVQCSRIAHGDLEVFTGKSLKRDRKLWEAFQNLRSARNSFSHGGKAVIGKGASAKEVTPEKAAELVGAANAIVDWCETLLPAAVRRPLRSQSINFHL